MDISVLVVWHSFILAIVIASVFIFFAPWISRYI